ncbi:puromycin-sensitive aminopeptidase-like [Artemia franciscana]|uniref:Aminopeptidase n=1 Tax=Artemia franciscana TaxID=6661 RepID=A0AA88ING3_ARTSF|nr:hypothetical protein QYM36_007765 [Artemia franciscana]
MTEFLKEKTVFQRLPENVIPVHYEIMLEPNLEDFNFAGETNITIKVVESTSKIILNSLDLLIDEAKLEVEDGRVLIGNTTMYNESETAAIVFDTLIPKGNSILRLKFTGTLNSRLNGFYRAKYTIEGEVRHAACTQFEPTGARRCFPCWDEPNFKATFQFVLVVPKDKVALNNMPEVSSIEHPTNSSLRVVKFDTTPMMSTYITAVYVGEADFIESKTNSGVVVRVFTPKGEAETGRFSLDLAVKTLEFFDDYFKVPYPLPKADMIAISEYYGGAMENWGLVTFRETALLVDPVKTSVARKKRVASTVMHELAHMWFGNLVTMEWWTDLWLKEGFATFCSYLSGDKLLPSYEFINSMFSDCYGSAFHLDCLRSSHPIEVPVSSPNEIDEIFDEISYSKGSVLINMIHNFIGDEFFRNGMNMYLRKFAYKNSKTEDLWEALGEASSLPVKSVMSTWTRQMGFPLISVSIKQVGGVQKLEFSQERFIADGSKDENGLRWMVPITAVSEKSQTVPFATFLLDRSSEDIIIDSKVAEGWIKVNYGQLGFYRVKYSEELLKRLVPPLKSMTLPPLDRLGIVTDVDALVQAGKSSTVDLLELFWAYQSEDSYVVWSSICSGLSRLQNICEIMGYKKPMDSYTRKLLQKVLSMLGWNAVEGEKVTTGSFRARILLHAGLAGDKSVLEESRRRFKRHLDCVELIPADLRAAIYCIVMAFGDKETFETLKKLFNEESSSEERQRIGSAFGQARDESILHEVLEFSESEHVRKQESVLLLGAVASSQLGQQLAWNYYKEKHEDLVRKFPGAWHIGNVIQSFTSSFASEERAKEVEEFFSKHPAGVEMTVKQCVESIRLNAGWLTRDGESLKKYLDKYAE